MQCLQKALYFLLSLQNFGVFLRGTLQSERPKKLYRAVAASPGSAILRSDTGNSWGKVDIYS